MFSAGVVAGVLGDLGTGNATQLGPTRPVLATPPVPGAGEKLAGVVAQGFGLDAGQVAAVLGYGASSPTAAPGVPLEVTQPSAPQDLGHLTAADFTGARLGLQSQVLTILGAAKLAPAADAAHADEQGGHQP